MPKKRSKYKTIVDGEGFVLKSGERFKLACCDCGLVHQIVIVAHGRQIGVAMKRDKRATAGKRRASVSDELTQ